MTQVLNSLLSLAQHSAERAGATGTALVRVSLWASVYDHPLLAAHAGIELGGLTAYDYANLRLGHFSHGNRFDDDSIRSNSRASGESVCLLESVAREGVALTQTAAYAISPLLQAFGIIEPPQIRQDGTIRLWAFPHGDEAWWHSWCAANDIPAVHSGD